MIRQLVTVFFRLTLEKENGDGEAGQVLVK